MWKAGIFRTGKEIKELRGGVLLYAAQARPQIDAARYLQDIGYRHGEFEHVRHIPAQFAYVEKKLNLYSVNQAFNLTGIKGTKVYGEQ